MCLPWKSAIFLLQIFLSSIVWGCLYKTFIYIIKWFSIEYIRNEMLIFFVSFIFRYAVKGNFSFDNFSQRACLSSMSTLVTLFYSICKYSFEYHFIHSKTRMNFIFYSIIYFIFSASHFTSPHIFLESYWI